MTKLKLVDLAQMRKDDLIMIHDARSLIMITSVILIASLVGVPFALVEDSLEWTLIS